MKLTTASACLTLVSVVSAAALQPHLNHKRALEIVTVTEVEWDVVTVTEYDLPAATTTAQAQAVVPSDAATTSTTTQQAAVVETHATLPQAAVDSAVAVVAATTASTTTPAAGNVAVTTSTSAAAVPVTTQTPQAQITTQAAAIAATTAAAASPSTSGNYSGDGTFYELGLTACGQTYTDSDYVAAISYKLFDQDGTANPNNNPHCGKKIRVFRNDKSVDVTIVDRCAGCEEEYAVDLSPVAFNVLAAESEGRVAITWSYL